MNILFPSEYFDITKVDEEYKTEYVEALSLGNQVVLFNFDEFTNTGNLKIYPRDMKQGVYVYRGWMLKASDYEKLYTALKLKGVELINTAEQYKTCHEITGSYEKLKGFTPRILVYARAETIDWSEVRRTFGKFRIKDSVKSVKGSDFPDSFVVSEYTDEQLSEYVEQFIRLRGNLLQGSIVLKEHVRLKADSQGNTNEFRVFTFKGKQVVLSQSGDNTLTEEAKRFIASLPVLDSNFYTVDIAELETGGWTVIETGDGGVSGLPEYSMASEFYKELFIR